VYKVDWKVCFTKWAKINSKMAMYHAFVEDDSFLCTGHLLHLTSILSNMTKEERGLPFRTGNPSEHHMTLHHPMHITLHHSLSDLSVVLMRMDLIINSGHWYVRLLPCLRLGYEMFDGFDDSSTFMSREIAEVFADHYLEEVLENLPSLLSMLCSLLSFLF
jgi:hypothetical protein